MTEPGSSPSVTEGRRARRERLLELIDRRRLGAMLLRRCANFAWYTGGADSSVERANPLGVADIVLTPETELVLASTMSGPRMRAEQVPWAEVVERPWHEADAEDAGTILRQLGVEGPLGADVPIAGASDVGEQVAARRRVLDPDAIDRLRGVGADATRAIDAAAAKVEPGVAEPDLAAELAAACRRRGLIATVLLVGADQRIEQFRHPVPSEEVIQRRALLAISAVRGGLYANVTRIVELEAPAGELESRLAACGEILARMRDEATQPGRILADAFEDCRRFYSEAGYPDEWRLHHQGGITGYASREVIATPHTTQRIETGMAFAWNPSVTGAKAEETFVLTETGPEVVAGL